MSKIEEDKPLPSHTKLDYEECYAKIVLESLFPDKYKDLQIVDKPDLINNSLNYGIEVTSASSKWYKEAIKLWYMMPYVDDKRKEYYKERMKQLGVEYQGGIQAWPPEFYLSDKIGETPLNRVLLAFEKKVKKLNGGHYCKLQRYDIFIDSEVWLLEENIEKFLDEIILRNIGKLTYNFLYLTTSIDIYVFDLKNRKYDKILYSSFHNLQWEWATKARDMVVENEIS